MKDEFNEFVEYENLEDDYPFEDDYYYEDDDFFDTMSSDDNYEDDDVYKDYQSYDVDRNNTEYDTYSEYSEEEEGSKKDFRGIVVKLIIILFTIALVIWLVIMGISANNDGKKSNNNDEVTTVKSIKTDNDKLFEKMKEAALNYYNEDNIDSDDNTLTLQMMIELELIADIDDQYDLEESQASITKSDSEYQLNLKLVYDQITKTKTYLVSNYSYCDTTYLCEKQENSSEDSDSSSVEDEDVDAYLYEYIKEGKISLSDWSLWSDYEKTSCDTEKVSCNNSDGNCLTEVKIYKRGERTGTQNKVYKNYRSAFKTLEKETGKVCGNYDYIKINGVYYRTEKDSNFKVLGAIKKDTQSNYYNWKYNGRASYKTPPNDTINTRYVFVSADYTSCGTTCNNGPNYYYDSYVFTKGITAVSSLTADCNTLVTKVIPNYSITQQEITVSREEGVYETACYKSIRTRTKTDDSTTKWSKYNDEKLLDDGYTYTGNKKEK